MTKNVIQSFMMLIKAWSRKKNTRLHTLYPNGTGDIWNLSCLRISTHNVHHFPFFCSATKKKCCSSLFFKVLSESNMAQELYNFHKKSKMESNKSTALYYFYVECRSITACESPPWLTRLGGLDEWCGDEWCAPTMWWWLGINECMDGCNGGTGDV